MCLFDEVLMPAAKLGKQITPIELTYAGNLSNLNENNAVYDRSPYIPFFCTIHL